MPFERAVLAALAFMAPAMAAAQPSPDTAYITQRNGLSVKDQTALRQVIVRLNHALDAADYDLYASFFGEDAEFISDFGTARGRDAIAAALEQSRPFITGKRHVAANFLFSGDESRAEVTTYLIVFERTASVDYVGSALNTDTFEKRDGEWALIRHNSVLDPSTKAAMQAMMSAPPQD